MEALVTRSAIALALAASLAVACSPPGADGGDGPPLATIKAESALKLVMPGSRVIGPLEQDRENTIEGPVAALAGAEFETTADQTAVFAYYEDQLAALGWTPTRAPLLSTIDAAGRGWCKPRMNFRVTVFDPKPAALRGIIVAAGTIRYQALIVGGDEACPGP